MLQHVREIGVRDVAQHREELAEILVDLENLEIGVGEVGRRDRVAEVEKAQFDNVGLVEKVFDFHGNPPGYRSSFSLAQAPKSRRHCARLPMTAPQVVTQ